MKKAALLNLAFLFATTFLPSLGSPAPARTVFVDAAATGTNNGSSWQDAYICLQDALTVASAGDQIRVAQGIYKPDRGAGIALGDRAATFQLKNGVAIKGGYAGCCQPDPNQRNIELYETILSGDLKANDTDVEGPCDLPSEPSRAENSYHVLTGGGTKATAVLDGFIVTGGNANSSYPYDRDSGAGMYNSGGSGNNTPTVTNCTFCNNSAVLGGGMYNFGRGGSPHAYGAGPTLTNCTFSHNWARSGGAMYNRRCSAELTNCDFVGNSAVDYGGAMVNSIGRPTLTNCTFRANRANLMGGAIDNGSHAVIVNCTFSENSARQGGAISHLGGYSPTFTNCHFTANSAAEDGGAMYNYGLDVGWWCTPTLTDCTFSDNTAQNNGGAICNWCYANPTVTNSSFTNNVAQTNGGGMYNYLNSSPSLTECTFSKNSAAKKAGAIYNETASHAILHGCAFHENSADRAGAVYNDDSNSQVTDCVFHANTATQDGGAIVNNFSYPSFVNCTFSANSAEDGGGMYSCCGGKALLTGCIFLYNSAKFGAALHHRGCGDELTNCTIGENTAEEEAGGIYCGRSSHVLVTNSIIWNNTAPRGSQIFVTTWANDPAFVSVSYSDVQAGRLAVFVDPGGTLDWGPGNIDADPHLVNVAAGDCHLSTTSACINTGDPDYDSQPEETDIDGQPRVINGRIDMGADEFAAEGPVITVSPRTLKFYAVEQTAGPQIETLTIRNVGTGTLNWQVIEDCPWLQVTPSTGSSTGQPDEIILRVAMAELASGVHNCSLTIVDPRAVNSPQIVPVVSYCGAIRVPSQFGTIQDAIDNVWPGGTVLVADGTYQGPGNHDIDFKGKAIRLRSENGPGRCIIDCQGSEIQPHRGFYFHHYEQPDSIVDGFTIINGYADRAGGGILFESSSPTITNCVISQCVVTGCGNHTYSNDGGGGICCTNYSSPAITDCTITGNSARGVFIRIPYGGNGGAIRCSGNSSPTLNNCTISGNTAEYAGGGLYCDSDSSPTVTNCTISDNRAAGPHHFGEGGGLYLSGGSRAIITNCRISGNKTSSQGGAVGAYYVRPVLTNCMITGNHAGDLGGAIYIATPISGQAINNCTISDNAAGSCGGGIFRSDGSGRTTISNCIIWANAAPQGPQLGIATHSFQPAPQGTQLGIYAHRFQPEVVVAYSDIQGGAEAAYRGADCLLNWLPGSIDAEPMFAREGHWADANHPAIVVEPNDPNAIWTDGDYHLKSQGWRWNPKRKIWTWDDVTSPCIDAGSPGSLLGEELIAVADDPDRRWGQNLRINMGAYGGTAEASMAPYGWALLADLTNDGIVDFRDFSLQAAGWLTSVDGQAGDLNRNHVLDSGDLALLADDWLMQTAWRQ